MTTAAHAAGPSPVELEKQRQQRTYRRERRKARAAAGEIKELNIVAMMDMMTILLVFLLKSYQASTLSVNVDDHVLRLPASTTQEKPTEAITITVSQRDVSVNDRKVIDVVNGGIPAAAKGGKGDSFYVAPLYDALKKEVDKQKYIARYNSDARFEGRVSVVADKQIAYRTIMDVLYTAGQAELGEYNFLVLKNE
ncbi:ExbD/TolR family protein [Anaeromyxobacter oryzisoli]|jgi:biopolymer transport protein ExbD|uniref:ExbD/TolR family protein n=1 Tax=Anaeromyxobacter oryzisoli TaxID=2925408 RepID=UPI001F58E652|nr:biopolymer transporter ExbD [Anaeromyxobacter sp. SG63]